MISEHKIIIVDNTAKQETYHKIIEHNLPNCSIHTASDFEDLYDKVMHEPFDGIIHDAEKSFEDGIKFCSKVKTVDETKNIPVILVLDSNSDEDMKMEVMRIGADDFLTKPYQTSELIVRINVILRIKEAEDQLRTTNKLLINLVDQQADSIREKEHSLSAMVNSMNEGIIAIDNNGKISRINPQAEQMTGWGLAEALDQPLEKILKLVKGDAETPIENLYKKVLDERIVMSLGEDVRLLSKSGEKIPVEGSGSAIIESLKNKVEGAVFILTNITEKKRAQEALIKSNKLFRSLFEQSPIGLIVFDRKGNIVNINEKGKSIFGIESFADIENVNFLEDPNLPKKAASDLKKGQTYTNEIAYDFNLIDSLNFYKTNRKDTIHIYMIIQPLYHEEEISGYLAHIQDISDLRNLQQQLLHIQKLEAVGTLAGGLAHDYNNIISVVLGYSEMALSMLNKQDPIYSFVKSIYENGQRAESLTRQILAFSRKQVLEMKVINLNDVITHLNKMLSRLIGENIELQLILDPDLYSVKADIAQTEQVIINIVINAKDAMPSGGQINIKTSNATIKNNTIIKDLKPGEYVLLEITDFGCGIPNDLLPNIFEPFFTTKKVGKGTGLGLSTVYGIIKQSNGTVTVESEVGQGTSFKIYLPAEKQDADKQEITESQFGDKRFSGNETILIVEDEETVRNLLHEILSVYGYKTIGAANAGEALLTYEKQSDKIDLILTDVVMPTMNGIELSERLKQIKPDLKVIYCSGYAENTILKQKSKEKDFEYISKPYDPAKLVQKIRSVLDK